MLKSLFTKWNIFTIVAAVAFVTTVSVASAIPIPEHPEVISYRAEYILKNEIGTSLSQENLEFRITNADLINNEYTNKILLTKTSLEDAYLRVFINISKQKNNMVYSVDDYNNTEIEYTIDSSNYIDGEPVISNYEYEDEVATEVNYCWKYYNKKITSNEPVEIFDKITFENGLETSFTYVVIFSIEMINAHELSSSIWQDKPISWINTVNN